MNRRRDDRETDAAIVLVAVFVVIYSFALWVTGR